MASVVTNGEREWGNSVCGVYGGHAGQSFAVFEGCLGSAKAPEGREQEVMPTIRGEGIREPSWKTSAIDSAIHGWSHYHPTKPIATIVLFLLIIAGLH